MATRLYYGRTLIGTVPGSWGKTKIDDALVDIQGGFACAKKYAVPSGLPHLRPFNVTTSGEVVITNDTVHIPLDFRENVEPYYLQKNDVLFNNTNSVELVGKTGIVREPMAVAFSNHINRLRVRNENLLDPKWLTYFLLNLQSQGFFATHCRKRIGQAGFSLEALSKVEIPLPDINIQRQIVQYIDTLFLEAHEMQKLNQHIHDDIKKLMDAVAGELYDLSVSNDIEERTLADVCEINPRRPKILRDPNTKTFFIPMASVDELKGEVVDLLTVPYSKVRSGYTYFEENDVLFAKITPSMQNGKSAIARDLIDGFGFGTTEFHVLRPKATIMPEWIHFFVRQTKFLEDAMRHFRGAVGQQRVPDSFLRTYLIPVPFPNNSQKSLATQKEMVVYLKTIQDEIVEMKKTCKEDSQLLKQIEKSILAQAFQGEL
jgi:type I restriction enzyme S subunit